MEVATGIVAGLEVRPYDTDGDRFADAIEADYKEGVQVQDIVRHTDGTVSVRRGDIDTARRTGAGATAALSAIFPPLRPVAPV